jgi:dynein light chain LC8-type
VCSDGSSRAQYNGVWHCFIGRNFGTYTIHEQGHNVYFYMGQMAVVLFKTG